MPPDLTVPRWDDIRRMLAREIGPHLVALGFQNPGRAMWRYRPHFVDVVEFSCRRAGTFQLEYGSTLRRNARLHPHPYDCIFRVAPEYAFNWPFRAPWRFAASIQQQRAFIQALSPLVTTSSVQWFRHFSSVSEALRALDANADRGPNEVSACRLGSPAYYKARAALLAELRTPPEAR